MGTNTKDGASITGLLTSRRRRRGASNLLVKSSPNEAAPIVFCDWLFDATGGPATITGTLAATDAADTAAFTGDIAHVGSLAATDGADSAAFVGDLAHVGSLAATDGADTAAMSGVVAHVGTLAATDGADGFAATGVVVSTEAPRVGGGVSRRWIQRRRFWANQEVYKSVVAAYREAFRKEIEPEVAEQVTEEVVEQIKAKVDSLPERDIEAEITWIEVQARIMQAVMQLEDEEDEETAIFAML